MIVDKIKPLLTLYGHIHEGYGSSCKGGSIYLNAASVNRSYLLANPAIVVDLPMKKKKK